MPLLPGSQLGPYTIVGPLGAGGMGEVYRARDARLGREVAIKILPEAMAEAPERLARFEREARTVAALNHPYHSAGDLAAAEDAYRQSLELAPGTAVSTAFYALSLLDQGRADRALAAVADETDESNRLHVLAIITGAMGRKEESEEALGQLIAKYGRTMAARSPRCSRSAATPIARSSGSSGRTPSATAAFLKCRRARASGHSTSTRAGRRS
jgi:tetratricopeptide (TPR) repeat protein